MADDVLTKVEKQMEGTNLALAAVAEHQAEGVLAVFNHELVEEGHSDESGGVRHVERLLVCADRACCKSDDHFA